MVPKASIMSRFCRRRTLGPQAWKRSSNLLAEGIVAPEAMITHRPPLEEAEKGSELAAKKEAAKVLFIP